jgi:hypothetical protein
LQRYYTSVGFDLIDNLNQRQFYNIPNLYLLTEQWLYLHHTIRECIEHPGGNGETPKSRFDNPTEQFVDELFNN